MRGELEIKDFQLIIIKSKLRAPPPREPILEVQRIGQPAGLHPALNRLECNAAMHFEAYWLPPFAGPDLVVVVDHAALKPHSAYDTPQGELSSQARSLHPESCSALIS